MSLSQLGALKGRESGIWWSCQNLNSSLCQYLAFSLRKLLHLYGQYNPLNIPYSGFIYIFLLPSISKLMLSWWGTSVGQTCSFFNLPFSTQYSFIFFNVFICFPKFVLAPNPSRFTRALQPQHTGCSTKSLSHTDALSIALILLWLTPHLGFQWQIFEWNFYAHVSFTVDHCPLHQSHQCHRRNPVLIHSFHPQHIVTVRKYCSSKSLWDWSI